MYERGGVGLYHVSVLWVIGAVASAAAAAGATATCFSPPSRQSLELEFDEKPTGACSDITYMIMFMSCEADAHSKRQSEMWRGSAECGDVAS